MNTLSLYSISKGFLCLLLSGVAQYLYAQSNGAPKEMGAIQLNGEVLKMDGIVDEEFWLNIPPSGEFRMQEPIEGGEPTEKTEVRIAYDDKNIYISAILYDKDPSGIKAAQKKRDASLRTDDRFMLIFDTFMDRRRAYFFEINPRALRGDGLIAGGQSGGGGGPGGRAVSKDWDGIWNAWTQIGDFGWSAEIKIPFQTLNFDPNSDTWGVNFQRTIRRYNEELLWTGYRRNQGIFRPQNAGNLTGLGNMSQGIGLEIIPYGIAEASKSLDEDTDEYAEKTNLDAGFDVNYNITPSLKASFTYNTDFAQTEVDDRRINLTRFPLRFPEKRDFFLEGTGILRFAPSSGVDPYFSRRIGLNGGVPIPIRLGGRLLGNIGENNIALIQVRTASQDTLKPEDFTVARYKRNLWKESSVGIIYTRRSTDDGELLFDPVQDRHTLGLDMDLNTSDFLGDNVLQFSAFFVAHNQASPGDDSTNVYDRSSRGLRVNFPNRPWSASVSYREFGDSYDPAVGFNRRNGFRRFNPNFSYSPLFEESNVIREIEWGIRFEHLVSLDNKLLTQDLQFKLAEVRFESGERFEVEVSRNFEFLDEPFDILRDSSVIVMPGEYTNWQYQISASTASFRKVSGFIRYEAGGFWTGEIDEIRMALTLRPIPGINLRAEYSHTEVRAEGSGFNTNLLQIDLGFDFTPDISLSSNIQFDDVSDIVGTNTRFRWIVTPGTDIYLVYNHNWQDQLEDRLRTLNQGVALKAAYTHRF